MFSQLSNLGVKPDDDPETILSKSILIKTSLMIIFPAIIWGSIYLSLGEIKAGLIPIAYSILSIISFLILKYSNTYEIFRFTQIFLMLLLPFLLMITLGGFVNGSGVIIWALLAPIGALLSGKLRQAIYWFIAFNVLVLISGLIQPYIRTQNNLPPAVINLFFTINILSVTMMTFLVLTYFVKNKDKVINLLRKNRELEESQQKKELLLRESDKLATLGRLSAGIAHELNNPASVASRGSKYLLEALGNFQKSIFILAATEFTKQQLKMFSNLEDQITNLSKNQPKKDALTRSDNEEKISELLEKVSIENPSQIASWLVDIGFSEKILEPYTIEFKNEQLSTVLSVLYINYHSKNLLEEIEKGTEKIIEIVKSLKSYSYKEEAPLKLLDIHEGLNDAQIILRNQLKSGIELELKYDKNLPLVEAHSNELIQVWTNIIDNAITAMKGKGKIQIKTYTENEWAVVQIMDNGPGIDENIQERIFDPFFTTKLPGEGTGLGLNISYDIIVNHHKGEVNVFSEPGKTCFEVRLPIKKKISSG